MRAMIIAGALAAAATCANAAEPAACYDAAVIGLVTDYANAVDLATIPMVPGAGVFSRVQADMLIYGRSQVAGPDLPEEFWARAVVTETPDPGPPLLIYLKNEPDGVPSVVGYRLAPPFYRPTMLTDYPAC